MLEYRMAGQAWEGVHPCLRDPFCQAAAHSLRLVSGKHRDGGASFTPAGGAPVTSRASLPSCFTK